MGNKIFKLNSLTCDIIIITKQVYLNKKVVNTFFSFLEAEN